MSECRGLTIDEGESGRLRHHGWTSRNPWVVQVERPVLPVIAYKLAGGGIFSDMFVFNMPPAFVLFGSYVVFWSAMALSPADWHNWILASVIPAIVLGGLVAGRRVLPLSAISYLLIGAFITLHTIGAHYTYARVPLGDWLSPFLGDGRNDYDRVVHFAFGLLLASPIRDVFARIANVRGLLLYYLPIMTIVGLSSLWEILESWVAQIVSPELGAAYLGAQGDMWDAQKDMAAALYGALLWLALSVWAKRRSARVAAEPVAIQS